MFLSVRFLAKPDFPSWAASKKSASQSNSAVTSSRGSDAASAYVWRQTRRRQKGSADVSGCAASGECCEFFLAPAFVRPYFQEQLAEPTHIAISCPIGLAFRDPSLNSR
jgi:hypothetical protein